MNRVFQAKISWYQYLYLLILGALTFFLLWEKIIIIAILCMLLVVFAIERVIHTTYTLTSENELIISTGRYGKPKVIHLKEIHEVELRHSARFGKFSITEYILITYGTNRHVAVTPLKKKEFINLLLSKQEHYN
ncbi:ABC transporter [Bacteroides sp. 214]|uniref:PH domain-containing protein n=1 Tax=Bacteroides sp. 214 TaxID=2302935 RepID=UPI0013D7BD1F|nr:PH domain-containing protein [Bacteroides sp. 214]NDW13552.1 ABC transporter [Bacteroides sp. 214]